MIANRNRCLIGGPSPRQGVRRIATNSNRTLPTGRRIPANSNRRRPLRYRPAVGEVAERNAVISGSTRGTYGHGTGSGRSAEMSHGHTIAANCAGFIAYRTGKSTGCSRIGADRCRLRCSRCSKAHGNSVNTFCFGVSSYCNCLSIQAFRQASDGNGVIAIRRCLRSNYCSVLASCRGTSTYRHRRILDWTSRTLCFCIST